MRNADLAENLRLICSTERSVSDVCRRIGINRQQFNKYLNGSTHPSSHNLQRICDHFAIEIAELYLPHEQFADRFRFRPSAATRSRERRSQAPLLAAFRSDPGALHRYLGYYQTHCHAFSWDGYVVRALSCLYEHEQTVCTRTIERSRDPEDGTLYRSKYDGQVAFLSNRVYVVEHESRANDALTETILKSAGRGQINLLRGVTFGLSNTGRQPCVSRCVWKYLGADIDRKAALRTAGIFPTGSDQLDGNVVRMLGEKPVPNELLRV